MSSPHQRLDAALDAAHSKLASIPEDLAGKPLKPGGWSRKQILGHLLDSASNNHQRFVRCAIGGGLSGWPSYEQNEWEETGRYQEAPWSELVEFWAAYNRLLSRILSGLRTEQLALSCEVGGKTMTLGELAASYVDHLEHHLEQVLR